MTGTRRVVVGEDEVLLREGIVRLLTEAGFDVVAQAGDAEDLLRKGLAHRPDLVIADINMPPGHGDDGLRAALEVRQRRPETGVLILSQYFEERYALDLIADGAEGVGYLLKERVGQVETFVDAAARVADGRSALDPDLVARMLGRRRRTTPIDLLSPRELEVLAAMAEGMSNRGIGKALMHQSARGGKAHHEHLPEARAASGRGRASTRTRGPVISARDLAAKTLAATLRSGLLTERERRTDAGAATRRAVDPHLAAERGDPIRQAPQTASFRPGTSDSIVAYVQVQAAVLDACGDGRALGLGVLGQVRQRFGDHEVRVGLDLGTEPVSGHLDGDRQPQPFDQLLDACG